MVRFMMSALLIVLVYLTILPLAVAYSHAAATQHPAPVSHAR